MSTPPSTNDLPPLARPPPSSTSSSSVDAAAHRIEKTLAVLAQKMEIEKKRKRLEVLTQTLEDEKSWQGSHEVR